MVPSLLMEEHQDAYFFWKKLGVSGFSCVHVDAHLDVCNLKMPGSGSLDCPELNCGNFLLRSIQEGQIKHLIWVIPLHLVGSQDALDWARNELQNWMRLSLSEYMDLHLEAGRVEGHLAGIPLTICRSDQIPDLEGPVLVDVDVDYYLGPEDEVWQDPIALARQLAQLHPVAVTVAYSVVGGYTPVHLRYLGDLSLLALTGEAERAEALWRRRDQPAADDPAWLRAAAVAARAQAQGADFQGPGWDEAAALDSAYRPLPLDIASLYFIRHRHQPCRAWLAGLQDPTEQLARGYLEGLMAFREEQDKAALEHWLPLVEHPQVKGDPRMHAHLLELIGRAHIREQNWARAEHSLREAIRLDRRDAGLWRELGRALLGAGREEESGRCYRKAIGLAPDELATLESRLELARLYARGGQVTLAEGELARLTGEGVPSMVRMRAEVLAARILCQKSRQINLGKSGMHDE